MVKVKSITDVQELIKNEEKMCIFVDYNNLSDNLKRLCLTDARENRDMRIVENFIRCPFLNIYVLYKKNMPQKYINNIGTKFDNIVFMKYEKDKFMETCAEIDDSSKFLYIGNNEDIINMEKFQQGYTISINYALKKTCKTVDFQLSIDELLELMLETNNICL